MNDRNMTISGELTASKTHAGLEPLTQCEISQVCGGIGIIYSYTSSTNYTKVLTSSNTTAVIERSSDDKIDTSVCELGTFDFDACLG